jgi:preprotein translocase subunit SecD
MELVLLNFGGQFRMSHRSQRLIIPILILVLVTIYIVLPNSPGIHLDIGENAIDRDFDTRLGLDLVGGVQALLEADLPEDTAIDPEAMRTARAIVENRVNGLGVSEAVVQQAGDRRILVELPGETDPQKALETIQQTGLLEFVDMSSLTPNEAITLVGTTIQTDFGQSGDTPPAAEPTLGAGETITPTAQLPVFHTIMTGAGLKNVAVTTGQTGEYQVAFELQTEETQTFADFTAAHVGQILAIILDKQVISVPSINQAITDGQGVITGNFTVQAANDLAIQLRYGSLPIPLKVITSQTVGPTLGQDSLQRSLVAGIVGMLTVVIFMVLYYRLPGFIADLALIVYALITFALYILIPVTMTLPGIAGFILSVGVAVDANILIFERLKEELRAGRNLRQAIDLGWNRAWPSIRDSNLATLITCGILFWFGSTFGASIVKGFSLTLAVGVLVSMFTAIIVARTFLHLVLDRIEFAEHHSWFGL